MKNSTEEAMNDIGEVVRQYKDMVYRIALMRVQNVWDAEDVFQEVFVTYLKKQPVCENEEHRKAWLIRTTINYAKKITGSTWKKRVDVMENTETLADGAYEFEQEEENQVFLAIKKLPDKYQIVLELFYFEELSTKKIAELLSVGEAVVRMRLSRAREKMRKQLENL